ncbi:MAG: ATP-binding protein, partial [Chloroflexi bacterium]|nr:ATP-binding protein [Chloroflexota bacterium]
MTAPTVDPERTPRLADRLAAARRARFVGRQAELELFRSALLASEPPFAVLHVHGPGGIGKTALLAEYARAAGDAGAVAVRLDGRDVEPSPPGFLRALHQALGLAEGASPVAALSQQPRGVLLIDTYEALGPLDAWLRESFLPQLPGRATIVIAGRHAPASAWRTDPDWSDLARIVSLRNLPPEDSRNYLRARGIPEDQHPSVLSFTHGHPLALALVADLVARGEQPSFRPDHAPDVVRVLLERFVQQVPSAAHRRAVQVSARTRVTTESLLADVLGPAEAPALFEWLRGLSFVEQGPDGLFPHDLAREVLDADLRWRDPEGFRDLHGRVLRYLVRRLQARTGREQQRAYFDFVYLSRNSPLMENYYDWDAMGTAYAEPATPEDYSAILAMVRRHEGEASERIAAYWLGRRPDAFLAFRTARPQLAGFGAILLLDEANPEECAADPAVAAAWRFVQQHGPLRHGERLIHHRFWMSREAHQDRAAVTLSAAAGAPRWLTTPRLAWSLLMVADPDLRAAHFAAIGFSRAPDAEFEVAGRRFGVVAHDWRVEPPLAWIERKGQLDPAVEPQPPALEARGPLVVLSQPDFEAAVRQALRDYTRPAALASNPLLRSRVAVEHAEGAPTAAMLQAVLREAAESLRATPRDRKLYRALERTYLEPAESQEAVAELLGLPFSTYRYQLSGGIAHVTEWLWRRELEG